jgi:hypothetical protein
VTRQELGRGAPVARDCFSSRFLVPVPTVQRENVKFSRLSQGDKVPARGAQSKMKVLNKTNQRFRCARRRASR